MRLLLHVGHAKTGTSSIQSSLSAARETLKGAGVLYPEPPSFIPYSTNHNSLATGFGNTDQLLRGLKKRVHDSDLNVSDIFNLYCKEIFSQIVAEKPEKVVISGEALFKIVDIAEAEPFNNFIRAISSDITICIYTRRPSEYYLSAMQQKLKASSQLKSPRPLRIRERIESFQRVFGKNVSVRLYDKFNLKNQDVVADFVHHYLPEIEKIGAQLPTIRSNQGLSAEGMSILQSFRKWNFSKSEDIFNRPTSNLIELIEDVEKNHNLKARATLNRHVQEFIDYSSTDLIWLRDEFGIEIPDLDYKRINPQRRGKPDDRLQVHDICEVDSEKLLQLNMLLLGAATIPQSQTGADPTVRRKMRRSGRSTAKQTPI